MKNKPLKKRKIMTVGFEEELVDRLKAASKRLGISRSALLRLALTKLLDAGY